jgi:hypothetical protein
MAAARRSFPRKRRDGKAILAPVRVPIEAIRRVLAATSCWSLVLGLSGRASAGGPLGDEGSKIATSNYSVDLFQGPVLATTRITGLGGAFTAITEGTEGIQWNPTAASLRPPFSTTRDDHDLAFGVTLPSSVDGTDFDNDGKVGFAYDRFVWVTFGGILQHGPLGFGLMASFQNYELGAPGDPVALPNSNEVVEQVIVRVLRLDPVISYGFMKEQLHLGAGFRLAAFYSVGATTIEGRAASERLLLNANTAGVQAGALWAPHSLPLRVGAAARSPLRNIGGDPGRIAPNADGDRVIGNIYLPNQLELPWEVEAGVAVQLWRRPFNIPWTDEELVPEKDAAPWVRAKGAGKEPVYRGARRMLKARYKMLPRERVLLSASALMSGPVKNAVGVESMLSQTVNRSGEKRVYTVRFGAEGELVPWWLVVRAGSYFEPTRFRSGKPRVHGTFGFDLRVLESTVFGLYDEGTLFRVSGAVDVSRDYFGWSVGAGIFR